ncbi:NAD(P)-dependent oxidoreductase [Amycolatopsis sp. CA-128772]|uniref:NAD(P)-dependent oxidoreductase n=1 Tax=Amycolatopsis sp. CA-128772 TaxID=2073159 RepID=UPI000CD32891|nr:NAD(P)-dependent oxidoreductase [Amycolatopsis sp. CA-128772]
MVQSEPVRTLGRRGVSAVGVAVYGCQADEAALFREVGARLGVRVTLAGGELDEGTAGLAGGHRCVSVGHKSPVSHAVLRALERVGVRYVSTRSVGYDHIDVRYADSLGIVVGNVAYSPDSVADYTLMLMLMAVRDAKSVLSRAEAGDFRLDDARGKELRELTVGVVGTGRIGSAVVERLQGFGGRVVAFDSCPRAGIDYVHLDELVRVSDIVTLHTPLTGETRHLLDRRRLGLMKPGAFVVNTGRGSLLDTEALVAALENGRLGGAALDVLEGEEGVFYADRRGQPAGSELLARLQKLPNVVITPHTAYYTDRALRDTVENSVLNCLGFERGTLR